MLTQTIDEKDEEKLSENGREKAVEDQREKEEKKYRPVRLVYQKCLNHWQIAFKLIELVLCTMSVGFIIDPAKKTGLGSTHIHHFSLLCTAFIGYMLIITVLLVGRCLGDKLPYRTSALFSLVGAGLSMAAGTLVLADRTHFTNNLIFHPNKYYMDMMLTSGIFAIINSILYAIDAILTFRLQNDL